jgi:hypothetical protein
MSDEPTRTGGASCQSVLSDDAVGIESPTNPSPTLSLA